MRSGRTQCCDESIQFLHICLSQVAGTLSLGIRDRNRDDTALTIFGDIGITLQSLSCRLLGPNPPVDSTQIEPLHQSVLDGAAVQNTNEQGTRAVQVKEISG